MLGALVHVPAAVALIVWAVMVCAVFWQDYRKGAAMTTARAEFGLLRDEKAIIAHYARLRRYGASHGKAVEVAAMNCAYSIREVRGLCDDLPGFKR